MNMHGKVRGRLLIPAGFVLIFIVTIWFSLRDLSRDPSLRVPPPDNPAPVTPRALPRTIVFACEDATDTYQDYAEIVSGFEAQNPDIKVELKSYRDLLGEAYGQLSYVDMMQEVAAKADAFCLWDIEPLVEEYLLYNLDPLIARDPGFEIEDFYAAVMSTVRHERHVYAIPSRFQPALIRYDPAAFQDAGIPEPRTDWTWDDFLANAVSLTRRKDGNTERWGFGVDAGLIFSTRFSAALDDPAFLSAASADNPFLSESVVNLFHWYERFYVDARAATMPFAYDWAGESYMPGYVEPDAISQGKMAMWTDLMYPGAHRQGKPAPFPSGTAGDKGGRAPVYLDPAWGMAAETLHPEAAWLWLSYLSRNPPPDAQRRSLPARRSLVEQAAFWSDIPSGEARVYQYVLEHLTAPVAEPPSDAVEALYEDLRSMVTGRLTLTEVLARRAQAQRSTGRSPARVTVRFAAPGDALPAYEDAAREFEREWGIHIRLLASNALMDVSDPESTPLWTRMRQVAGRADVLAGPEVASLSRSGRSEGILQDLTSLTSALPDGAFYANTLESLQGRGRTWAVPARVRPYLILYNRGMFDEMGAPYPQLGWTWEDFERSADAVTRRRGETPAWFGVKDGPRNQLMLLEARLGQLANYGNGAFVSGPNESRAVEALSWYGALFHRSSLLIPDPEEGGEDAEFAAPANAAMWIAPLELSVLTVLRQEQIGAVPFPIERGLDAANPVDILDAYAISASTEQAVVAWQWIQYLLGRNPGEGSLAPGVSARPALLALAKGDNESKAVYRFALEHARLLDPLRPEVYLMRQALRTAVTGVTRESADPATALQDALQAVQNQIRR